MNLTELVSFTHGLQGALEGRATAFLVAENGSVSTSSADMFAAFCVAARRLGCEESPAVLCLVSLLATVFVKPGLWTRDPGVLWRELVAFRGTARAFPRVFAELSNSMADLLLQRGMLGPAATLLRAGLARVKDSIDSQTQKVAVKSHFRLLRCLRGEENAVERRRVGEDLLRLLDGTGALPEQSHTSNRGRTVAVKLSGEFFETERPREFPPELVRQVLLQRLQELLGEETKESPPFYLPLMEKPTPRFTFGQDSTIAEELPSAERTIPVEGVAWSKKTVRGGRALLLSCILSVGESESVLCVELTEGDKKMDSMMLSAAEIEEFLASPRCWLALPSPFHLQTSSMELVLRHCFLHFVGASTQPRLRLLARPDSLLSSTSVELPEGSYALRLLHQYGPVFALVLLPEGEGAPVKLEMKLCTADFWSFFSVVAATVEAPAALLRPAFDLRVDRHRRRELLGLVAELAVFYGVRARSAQAEGRVCLLRVADLHAQKARLLSYRRTAKGSHELRVESGAGDRLELSLPSEYLRSLLGNCDAVSLQHLLLRAMKLRTNTLQPTFLLSATFLPLRVVASRALLLPRGYWLPLVAELIDLRNCLFVVRLRLHDPVDDGVQLRFVAFEEALGSVCAAGKKRAEFFAETFELFRAENWAGWVEADAPLRFRANVPEFSIGPMRV